MLVKESGFYPVIRVWFNYLIYLMKSKNKNMNKTKYKKCKLQNTKMQQRKKRKRKGKKIRKCIFTFIYTKSFRYFAWVDIKGKQRRLKYDLLLFMRWNQQTDLKEEIAPNDLKSDTFFQFNLTRVFWQII